MYEQQHVGKQEKDRKRREAHGFFCTGNSFSGCIYVGSFQAVKCICGSDRSVYPYFCNCSGIEDLWQSSDFNYENTVDHFDTGISNYGCDIISADRS